MTTRRSLDDLLVLLVIVASVVCAAVPVAWLDLPAFSATTA